MSEIARDEVGSQNNNWTEDANIKDHSKDPYFMKKNKEATEFLMKHGLPEDAKTGVKK